MAESNWFDSASMFPESPVLQEKIREHFVWAKELGISTIRDLNVAIAENRADGIIRIAEARHNKSLVEIAAEIDKRKAKLILVAGPSSAGKTTFSKRLCTYLRVFGHKTLLISTDDYFVGDKRNPKDVNGKLDYEHLDAVDRPRMTADLQALFRGEPVKMRAFNFALHDGYDRDEPSRLESGGIVVMEGIHCLNPDLLPGFGDSGVFRVYLNTLAPVRNNDGSPIFPEDSRILRRLLRDAKYRKMSTEETLNLWPSVMRGEARWITPFVSGADAVFNSALDYEIAVLKPCVETALRIACATGAQTVEALRLLTMIRPFLNLPSDCVPGDSILRETIGNSQLTY